MFKRSPDFLAIGDVTTDAFIRLKDADIHCKYNHDDCEICFPFGAKVPFEYVKAINATGNAANAATAATRLGLRSALVSNVGNDQNGKDCVVELRKSGVDTSLVRVNHGKPTNYHFVLWYGSERTILVNHVDYEYQLPRLPHAKWIYLTSLSSHALPYHVAITNHLENDHKVRLAFQPGTFQLSLGFEKLKKIYQRTDVIIMNKQEAYKLVGAKDSDDKFSGMTGIKSIMKEMHERGPKIVIITDNVIGSYMFDGDHYYHMPIYPDARPALERTGCGDAFASTFVSALTMGKSPLEALTWAPVNPMSVAQFVGAREGLLTLEQLEWWLSRAPHDYRPREI